MTGEYWTLTKAHQALARRQLSARELAEAHLQQIHAHNSQLRAFLYINEDILQLAQEQDKKRAQGSFLPPLAGLPIAIKDLFHTKDMPTTYGSRYFAHHQPLADAPSVARLRELGALLIGKTHLHEFAFGTTSENIHYGHVRNPWNRSKIAGGSSGGSAVALASGMSLAALGTDTGGSVRIPAALTGTVGLKPSFGLISKEGVFPLAPSLDHVGPMTLSVDDAAWMLSLLTASSHEQAMRMSPDDHPYLPYSLPEPIRAGVIRPYFFDRCHPGVVDKITSLLRVLETRWLKRIDLSLSGLERVQEYQRVLITTEAYALHRQRLQENDSLFGDDVRDRLNSAKSLSAIEFLDALHFQKEFTAEMTEKFAIVDVLVMPTVPIPATDIGQSKVFVGSHEMPVRSLLNRNTQPFNFTGLPALSIPVGLLDGLPVGLQLVGPLGSERKLLSIGKFIEEAVQWNPLAPMHRT
ncbi:amidase [Alicyclobacillus tolerans]|uniref:Aspartyl-tRNA(Asn)/glutamyl-tRNA(Gln) amidotransferase subunit A n=1 Tax=Alicyclobacillus tolerans TaxID=90970 RepID=A0ABT9LW03_9BACL|nr:MULTISPECIES: amidase [Alicyclobacillus]MDP9728446.1 aspartyl-tRNA(Asn)/glutamyl-tRNA(Gln) amidotransferase subunit A [Alicyclobacillus tengchongensis]QRF23766.1 amidase [Alicyclobacillus sp. TC]